MDEKMIEGQPPVHRCPCWAARMDMSADPSCEDCHGTGWIRESPQEAKGLPFKGQRFGRLIVTTCRQPEGARFFDDAFTVDADENHYHSKAILLTPWRRRSRALVVGWRETTRRVAHRVGSGHAVGKR